MKNVTTLPPSQFNPFTFQFLAVVHVDTFILIALGNSHVKIVLGQTNLQICNEFTSKYFFPSLGKYVFVMVTTMLCLSPNRGKKPSFSL